MSLRKNTPCDIDGVCPYEATYNCECELWCGADVVEEVEEWLEEDEYEPSYDDDYDVGFDPYLGCYTDDC